MQNFLNNSGSSNPTHEDRFKKRTASHDKSNNLPDESTQKKETFPETKY